MRRGQLRDYFLGVGAKRLSAVDAEPRRSNQHEVGTTRAMRAQFLGEAERQRFEVIYIWLGNDQDGISVEASATHYDARQRQVHRAPEWRLYYPSNPITEAMREGDALFLAMDNNRFLYFIVAPQGSTSEAQLSWLFGLRPEGQDFVSRQVEEGEPALDFAARFVFDEIGIQFEDPDTDALDEIVEGFGTAFPTTAELSQVARLTLSEVNAQHDPDGALLAWLSHEEALFRRLERKNIASRLEAGFLRDDAVDVDGFIQFSLSVQNRRKARMGRALENHLDAVFRIHEVIYVRGAVTENNQRPDFLFPSLEAYQAAPAIGQAGLTMLGAKSTCKDRWRQVLAEASKIPRKHLLTLEPGISESQTAQMEESNLQLVVPTSIQDSYSDDQRAWLWSLEMFIQYIKQHS